MAGLVLLPHATRSAYAKAEGAASGEERGVSPQAERSPKPLPRVEFTGEDARVRD